VPLVLLRHVAVAGYPQPVVIPRSGWGADESLRFDANGKEIWPSAFYPVQKVIVHHTATQNGDPDPAATMRAIYYYDAVTQGWGDFGYNFVIDESGRIYEGRYSRPYAPGVSPTGEDTAGNGVTGAHALGYNSGTVGVALLGTLTNRDATPAARAALEKLIAWIDSTHGIDPQGASLYTNPVSGTQATFPNIPGHRDVGATECPGGTFYATLPTIRSDVASLIASTGPDFSLAASPSSTSTGAGGSVSYNVSVNATNGFVGMISLAVAGLPGSSTASFAPATVNAPGSATLTVQTAQTPPPGSYTLTITGSDGATTHSTSATLVVNPPPDFSLSLSPTSRTIKRGTSTTYTVSVGSQGSFTGSVALRIAGLPSGTTASFSPGTVVVPGSSTLHVSTTTVAPRGTFSFTVSGSGATRVHKVGGTLTLR
jgi:N-acetylmuramoyl-L-alanine amidase